MLNSIWFFSLQASAGSSICLLTALSSLTIHKRQSYYLKGCTWSYSLIKLLACSNKKLLLPTFRPEKLRKITTHCCPKNSVKISIKTIAWIYFLKESYKQILENEKGCLLRGNAFFLRMIHSSPELITKIFLLSSIYIMKSDLEFELKIS